MVTQAVYALYMGSFQVGFMHLQILDDKQRGQFGRSFPTRCVMLDDL